MTTMFSIDRIKRWGMRSSLGILDQAAFSGANFLLSIFLARQFSMSEFGELSMGLAVFSFFIQIYTSFSLEPMSILGPSFYREQIRSYLFGQVKLLFFLSIPVSILFLIILGLIHLVSRPIAAESVLIAVALGLPFMLLPFLVRRIFYVLTKPGLAFTGSAMYCLALVLIFYLALRFGMLTTTRSVLLVSAASLFTGIVLLIYLRKENGEFISINLVDILRESWLFGKWLVISGILIGLATQAQLYLTGSLASVEEAGAVRVLQLFVQPMMLTSTALSVLVTPSIATDFSVGAYRLMQKKIFQFTWILGGIALMYEIFLVLFASPINELLFNGKYSAYTSQIIVWGLVPVILSFFWGGVLALQAVRKPQAMVIISSLWTFFGLAPCFILIPMWGVWGATLSTLMGFIAALLTTWFLYWRLVHLIYMRESGAK